MERLAVGVNEKKSVDDYNKNNPSVKKRFGKDNGRKHPLKAVKYSDFTSGFGKSMRACLFLATTGDRGWNSGY